MNEMDRNDCCGQPDILFLQVLNEIMKEDKENHYKVKDIISKLDSKWKSSKIPITNKNSYNMAKKVMLSNRNGRDYFIFDNEALQIKLTEILNKKSSGFKWDDYYDANIKINPKYIQTYYAGKNEKKFISKFQSQYGNGKLGGKRRWGNQDESNISVDNCIKKNSKEVLIEIDSGNMAKLLVGQYFLLNELIPKEEKENTDFIFVVVHYYKDYNTDRTEKNLKLVKNCIGDKAIKFKVFTEKSFFDFYKKNDIDGLIKKLYDENSAS